jgi:hypothetical protein
MKKIAKAKSGKSFGMLSVKAGIDKNPNPTAADRIAGAKMNAGKAMYGKTMKADKAMYGTKVATKKPIKKAQDGTSQYMELPEVEVTASKLNPMEKKKGRNYRPASNRIGKQMAKSQYGKGPYGRKRYQDGGDATKETSQFMELPEANVTASRIVDKPNKPAKAKDYTRKVSRVNKEALKRSGAGARKLTNVLGMKKRFEDGGEVKMAKKGASVKKAMGKCKSGC